MTLLKKYLKSRRKWILLFALLLITYVVSFMLYRIPFGAFVYPSAIVTLFFCMFLIVDFIRSKRRHELLESIKTYGAKLIEDLPQPCDIDDEDYQVIIENLKRELLDSEFINDKRFENTIEYYTVWAHQIKTPIAAMKLTLQGEDSSLSRKLSYELSRIEQYVGMVLAFLRLDSNYTDYVFKEYSLDNIIKESVKKFAPEFISKKIKLIYTEIDKTIVTDEKWFSFVLEQILSNALKYTNEGEVRIGIDDNSKLYIEDTGIGIASEDLPRVFEKGYTGYNGRVQKSASGIGLYLCKRICDKLCLGISIESTAYVGTKVIIDVEQKKIR